MDKSKRIIILLAVGFSIIIIILGIILTPKPKEIEPGKGTPEKNLPSVFSVEPLQDQKGLSVVPQIVVTFSTSVVGRKVELKTSPVSEFITKIDVGGEKVIFSPINNLKPSTKYDLQVLVDDDPVFFWNVTTKKRGTTQKNLAAKVNSIRAKKSIIEDGFRISYDAPGDHFFVFIEKAPINTYGEKAKSWFKENGVTDLGALNISYIPKGSLTP